MYRLIHVEVDDHICKTESLLIASVDQACYDNLIIYTFIKNNNIFNHKIITFIFISWIKGHKKNSSIICVVYEIEYFHR